MIKLLNYKYKNNNNKKGIFMKNLTKTALSVALISCLLSGCGGSDGSDGSSGADGTPEVNEFQSYILKDSLEYSTSGLTTVISPNVAGSASISLKVNSNETSPSFIFLDQYVASQGSHIAKVKITPSGDSSRLSFENGSDSKDTGIVIPNDEWVDLSLAWDVEGDSLTITALSGENVLGEARDSLSLLRPVQVVIVGHGEEGSVSSTDEPLKVDSFEIFNSDGDAIYSEYFDKTSAFNSFGGWGDNIISSDSNGGTPAETLNENISSYAGSGSLASLSIESNSVQLVNSSDDTAAHAKFFLEEPMESGVFTVDLNPDTMDSTEIFIFLGTENGTHDRSVSYIKLRPEYYSTRVENVLYKPTESKPEGTNYYYDTGFQIPHGEWRTLQLSWDVAKNNLDIELLDEKGNSGYVFSSELINQVPVVYFDIKVGLSSETTQEGEGLLIDNYRVLDSEGDTIVNEGFDSDSLPSGGDWQFVDAGIYTQDSSTPIEVDPLDPAKRIDLDSDNQQYAKITDFMTDDAGEIRASIYGGSYLGTISFKLFYPIEETQKYKLTLASASTTNAYSMNNFGFSNGYISDDDSVKLGTFEKGKWLDVSVEYNREEATIFIDGVEIGTAKNITDNKLYYVRIISGSESGTTDVGIHVDDLNIITDLGRLISDDFESYPVGTELTSYNSWFLKETVSAHVLEEPLEE